MFVGNNDGVPGSVGCLHRRESVEKLPKERAEIVEYESARPLLRGHDPEYRFEYFDPRGAFIAEIRQAVFCEGIQQNLSSTEKPRVSRGIALNGGEAASAANYFNVHREAKSATVGQHRMPEEAMIIGYLDPRSQPGRELPGRLDLQLDTRLIGKGQEKDLGVWRQRRRQSAGQSDRKKGLSRSWRCNNDLMPTGELTDGVVFWIRTQVRPLAS